MLDLAQLTEFLDHRFTRTAFRLETLASYTSGSDGGDVDRYLRGENAADPARKEPRLRAERAAGKVRQRVHVLTSPLSGYLRYECEWGYLLNAAAGEDIRILDLAERPSPPELDARWDFWLIDDQHVILMHYDQDGRLAGTELAAPGMLPRYQAGRNAALADAEPYGSYWERHPEYHQVNRKRET